MRKLITTSTILFLGIVFLAGCDNQQKTDQPSDALIQKKEIQEETVQEVSPEELIDFENPGNDEVGKKVENIDSLINSTSTSDYADDLSTEILVEQE